MRKSPTGATAKAKGFPLPLSIALLQTEEEGGRRPRRRDRGPLAGGEGGEQRLPVAPPLDLPPVRQGKLLQPLAELGDQPQGRTGFHPQPQDDLASSLTGGPGRRHKRGDLGGESHGARETRVIDGN